MRKQIHMATALAASLIVTGCASTPKLEEMKQLNGQEATSALAGNTVTFTADYGRWAEFYANDLSGASKAWGSWGEELATSKTSVSDDGEICTQYEGEYEWAGSNHRYCNRLYQDPEGNYVTEITVNTWKPARQGKVRKVEIKSGDSYGLVK